MHSEKKYLRYYFSELQLRKLRIEPIAGDASTRKYYRVFSSEQTWILCIDPDFSTFPSNDYPFLEVQQLLCHNSVPVPRIIASSKSESSMLIEDCGNIRLQDSILKDPSFALTIYRESIDCMIRLQSIRGQKDTLPFNRSFDQDKLMFEFDFFMTHTLKNRAPCIHASETISTLQNEFSKISKTLFRQKHFVLNHRDYHSKNILVFRNKPVIIDFQDARMGLPQYDAVSLLKDSYVTLDQEFVCEMQRYHYDRLAERKMMEMSYDEYLYLFDMMAFQRNIKALGTFFHQVNERKNSSFEQYISPTLAYLPAYIERQKELKTAGKIILNLLEPLNQ
ncbi:MAG: phosphotransferase [Chlorobium phaeobacteroides]|uniref:Aminoglycoside phosphotransferase n=1 Tax=Chlorobium phaeobacteroides (strain BS1) TaxID=331678 RepID=B3EL06_CHLPB|nr:phosphotransferase [Chlorobium phaeobacteroides]MBL6955307.1 phosphotransferase [Chlorobium phaeobacteroides]NEX13437.1 aminoglycoside phosphotransferase [Prosthecochloris sp.]